MGAQPALLPLLGSTQATPAPERRTTTTIRALLGSVWPADTPWPVICCHVLGLAFLVSLGLLITRAVADEIHRAKTSGSLEYSAAITGADGLLPSGNDDLVLSPVFNVTVHIRQFDNYISKACIGSRSTGLTVSYRDVELAKAGHVPRVCEGVMEEGGVDVTAWGVDVAVPRFLRERLAAEMEEGEAAFDVVVAPVYGEQLVCKVKIGEGLCPCKFEY